MRVVLSLDVINADLFAGPVYGLRVLSTPIVVINSVQAARELLENRSSIYSNRVPPKMAEL